MKRVLSLSTRIFLVSSLPVCVALIGGFLAVRASVEQQARNGLRQSLRELGMAQQNMRADYDRRNQRLAAILGENAVLKAGINLLREGARGEARETVQDQLQEMWGGLDYDLLVVSDSQGRPVAGLVRESGSAAILGREETGSIDSAILPLRGRLYEVTTAPVNLESENIGRITAGKLFDIERQRGSGHALLLRGSRVVRSSFNGGNTAEIERALAAACNGSGPECEVRIGGESYLAFSLPMDDGYRILNLQSAGAAAAQFQKEVLRIFTGLGAFALASVFILSALGSRSVALPLKKLIARLNEAELTGQLQCGLAAGSGTLEVNQLALAFDRAAESIAEGQRNLSQAHLEFVEAMARTLDARDSYTFGHSDRVGEYAMAIGRALNLPDAQIEIIRVGAQLHDIGKIGVPDAVLQKPGKLTVEEFDLIRQHPQIGFRILGKVGRFGPFLPIVELHHEDHDGGGYPYGLRGNDIPIEARIVHVADAFDAMTSDRPYRTGMSFATTMGIILENAGRQFDPDVVAVFVKVMGQRQKAMEEDCAVA